MNQMKSRVKPKLQGKQGGEAAPIKEGEWGLGGVLCLALVTRPGGGEQGPPGANWLC